MPKPEVLDRRVAIEDYPSNLARQKDALVAVSGRALHGASAASSCARSPRMTRFRFSAAFPPVRTGAPSRDAQSAVL